MALNDTQIITESVTVINLNPVSTNVNALPEILTSLSPDHSHIIMGKKYYAVAKGANSGVYTSWDACKSQVHGVAGSVYKSFSSQQEASNWIASKGASSYSSGSGVRSSYGSGFGSSSPSSGSGGGGGGSSAFYSSYVKEVPISSSRYSGSSYSSSSGISKPNKSSKLSSRLTKMIYTDGASSNNQSRSRASAGVGVYFGDNDKRNISKPVYGEQTNQRAELQAIENALDVVSKELKSSEEAQHYAIATDSMYSIKSLTEWNHNWKKNGWKNAKGQDVANRDVIEKCLDSIEEINKEYSSRGMGEVKFEHVKGHSGVEGNEKADQLAVKAATK